MNAILFTPLATFMPEELQCVYMIGETYRIVPGNVRLLELATKWEEEGKIAFTEPKTDPSEGKVAGAGIVTPTDDTPQ